MAERWIGHGGYLLLAVSASGPGHLQLTLVLGAIGKIEVDKRLVWDTGLLRHSLEIVDGIAVQIDRDLLFHCLGIGIANPSGKIIFFSHNSSPAFKLVILPGLLFCCLACGDQSNDRLGRPIAVAHNQHIQFALNPKRMKRSSCSE